VDAPAPQAYSHSSEVGKRNPLAVGGELSRQVGVGLDQGTVGRDRAVEVPLNPDAPIPIRHLDRPARCVIAKDRLDLGAILRGRDPSYLVRDRFHQERGQLDGSGPSCGRDDRVEQRPLQLIRIGGALPTFLFFRGRLPGPSGVEAETDGPSRNECEATAPASEQGDMVVAFPQTKGLDRVQDKSRRQLGRDLPGDLGPLGVGNPFPAIERQTHRNLSFDIS